MKIFLAVLLAIVIVSQTSSVSATEAEFVGPIIASAEYVSYEDLAGILSVGDYVTFNDGMAAIFIGYPDALGLQMDCDYPLFAGRDDNGNAELYALGDPDVSETSIESGWLSIHVIHSRMVWWSDIPN